MTKNDTIIKEVTKIEVTRPHSVFSGDNTYTTLFVLPMYDVYIDSRWYKNFINGYIDDVGLRHCFKRPLFVLVKYDITQEKPYEVLNHLLSRKSFVFSYLVGTQGNELFRMFVFQCPVKYKSDYDKFIKAQYSQFSVEYKSKFNQTIRTGTGLSMESPLYGVIYKTPTLKKKVEGFIGEPLSKDQEYFGLLKPEFEIFRYAK